MCSADHAGDTGDTGDTGRVVEGIHVIGDGRNGRGAVAAFTRVLVPDGSRYAIDNRYYSANVPLRTYESVWRVPDRISGALVFVLDVEMAGGGDSVGGTPPAFQEFAAWWAERKQGRRREDHDDEDNADNANNGDVDTQGVEVPLIVAWGVEEGMGAEERLLEDVFGWSVDEGFELVCCGRACEDEGSAPEESGEADMRLASRETSGMERVREALQHCRWSTAEMKERPRGMGARETSARVEESELQGSLEEEQDDGEHEEEPEQEEPNWQRMNEEVLRAFAQLAACDSDSAGDSEGEEIFSKLASILRK